MSLIEKTYRNGEVIIREGDSGKSFFRILEGSAEVYSDYGKLEQLRLAGLEAGEYFGEMSILEEYPRSATIVANGDVTVVEIPGDEMSAYFVKDPDRIFELMTHIANRIRAMINDYDEARALLKEIRDADEIKRNKSLFAKIKKQIDFYQSNKSRLTDPDTKALRDAFAKVAGQGSGLVETYRKGDVIYEEGEEGKFMYILQGGKVSLSRDKQKISDLTPVSFFGETEMVIGGQRTATAVSESDDTYVEVISKDDLQPMFLACPGKVELILRHLSYRLRRCNVDFLNVCKQITDTYTGQ